MGKVLFSLAFAAALLGVASSEASAAGSFVCQAVGPRSVGYGRAYFVADAKWQALIRCERYSGICIISYCVPSYWLLAQAAAPECICEIVTSRAMTREVRWRRFVPSGRLHRAPTKCSNKERDGKNFAPKTSRRGDRIVYWALADVTRGAPRLGPSTTTSAPIFTRL
jgi:hypothetical protein